jgi:hypothetical protein
MTRLEANQILDEHKDGIRIHPSALVNKALWFCGDLRGTSPRDLIASCQDGENSGVQASCLAQGERVGE